ncbi:PTS sugar transporter subunit IIA [Erwinia oleae]|uniref:PTS sugar transporter subunit IIA n=1 Tax=Erwinia oleae TaxID=796334 RepID=UPI0005533262|nr:PTS fructose transporter subunit IIA [Erwinia oleae]
MITVILATHGPLAEALLASARMVYGELPHVFPVTLGETKGINDFRDEFAAVLHQAGKGADGVLVLCDLQSGTPWNVACHHAFNAETSPPMAILSGVNFPMLLESDDLKAMTNVDQAAARLLVLAKEATVHARRVEAAQSEDF